MHHRSRRLATFLTAGLTAVAAVALAPTAASASSPDVVISEVYGGGGNSGAVYTNDFVELYNRGTATVALSTWSVQYASASGTSWSAAALTGSIAPGKRYLVKLAGGTAGTALPAAEASGSLNMSATSGKVALVTRTTALTCGANCDTASGVRDFLGYGSANDYEGTAAAAGSNTTSVARTNPASDGDNNRTDFAVGAPSPQNSTGGGGDPDPGGGTCDYPSTRIRQIQGKAHRSPMAGSAVNDVRGVVTAVGPAGFWYQDPCPDTDAGTSEGVYVYTSSAPTARVGDEVSVKATVTEYRPGGASTANLTTTELTAPTVTKLGTRAVPAATVIGSGGRVPPSTVIDDDATGDVETSGTFDAATDGIDFYESLEGMRVVVNNAVATGPTTKNGEIPVLADNGAGATIRTARNGIMIRSSDYNPERVVLDDALTAGSTPTVDTGDHFTGPAAGVMDYSFGNFKLELTGALTRVSGGITPETTSPAGTGEVSVATFNVENLDPTDPQTKFDGLARQIVTNLASPGILAVEEIQDNDGAADSGTVDASQTWAKLIAAIKSAGGPAYDYRSVNPVNDADGGEPGGNIRVGFLFRTDKVSFAPGTAGNATTAVTASASGNSADPIALNVNPGRISPADGAWSASRKPLVGKFLVGGKPLYVVANHFNSKGGDDPLYGRNQPPTRSSETQRHQQAQLVADFVGRLRAVDANARIVVAGDLNDFEFSVTVDKLVSSGLTDLPRTLPDAERYSYVFEGNSQVLDQLLISPSLVSAGYSYDVVHVNAEFAAQLSDHDPQVVRLKLG